MSQRRTISDSNVQSSGRLLGRVFALSDKGGFGHARLPDNRRVWIDRLNLTQDSPAPKLGDIVEFELHKSDRGLEAKAIRVVPVVHEDSELARSETARESTGQEKKAKAKPPAAQKRKTTKGSLRKPPPTPESQGLYEKAAVARAEGRTADARRFFRQSLQAGAGAHVYAAFCKMELEGRRPESASAIIQQAIGLFPDYVNFYSMYGQMERRRGRFVQAEAIVRQGLVRHPHNATLRNNLGQILVDTGTPESLGKADLIFDELDRQGKLNKHDQFYQRYKAFRNSPRAGKAYEFFNRLPGIHIGIAGRRDLPPHVTDLVVEVSNPELNASFGIVGSFLVRCFNRTPKKIEIINLSNYLRSVEPHGVLGLQDGREVALNPSFAFVAVPGLNAVRDHLMSILSENNEVVVPLDDSAFRESEDPLKVLRKLLSQFLGSRDVYNSTLPVSGRRFFGRERLLVQLTDEVNHGQFLGIYGLRKMGKTSLIYQLRDEKLRDEAVAYVDLQASAALAVKHCGPLYWELERDLYNRLLKRKSKAIDFLRLGRVKRFSDLPENGENAALVFSEDMKELLDAMSSGEVTDFSKLVIVLDELERILPLAGQSGVAGYSEFFGLLRGLAQTERYRRLVSSVVVAANAAISERGYWEGRENPVFALYKPIFLPPLSASDCAEMIKTLGKGMSVYWEKPALDTVFKETGGHPFLTRSLCSQITRNYLSRPLTVEPEMVQAQIAPFIRDESDKLGQIVELLNTNFPEEEEYLEKIAVGEALPDLSDEALRHLIGYQLIAGKDSEYHMTLNLLRRWLRRRAGIKD